MKMSRKACPIATLALLSSLPALAQNSPGDALPSDASTEPKTLDAFFLSEIPNAFVKGKFNANVRARYEHVDHSQLPDDSNAGTIRTRMGFTTAPLYGFQGMLEAENILPIDDDGYNATGSNNQPTRPVIADVETTEVNQAWLSFNYTNQVTLKVGRQRFTLDNHRFVGDVGWRQNMQTFDAVTANWTPLNHLSLTYGYLWEIHRVFGDVSNLPAANTDFDSDSHLIHLTHAGWKPGKFTGYAHLLDLENAAGFAHSCATYGLSFAGNTDLNEKTKLEYRAEFAFQTDYADAPVDYQAEYLQLELTATFKPVLLGAGFELLGSDNHVGFRTPLATLHAFNGWADMFLTTPAAGLQDLYAIAQVTLPRDVPLRFIYHKFDADSGFGDYGHEFDAVISKKFGKHWTLLAKYAHYLGKDPAPPSILTADLDVRKVWAQIEFNF